LLLEELKKETSFSINPAALPLPAGTHFACHQQPFIHGFSRIESSGHLPFLPTSNSSNQF